MQHKHLVTALLRALDRYGTPEARTDATPPTVADPLAPDANVPIARPRSRPTFPHRSRRPGWVSVGEIEAAQSPNTYPRLTRKAIRDGCRALAGEDDSPVAEVSAVGLRTWVRVVPLAAKPATVPTEPDGSASGHETDPAHAVSPGGAAPEFGGADVVPPEVGGPDGGPSGASGAGPTA